MKQLLKPIEPLGVDFWHSRSELIYVTRLCVVKFMKGWTKMKTIPFAPIIFHPLDACNFTCFRVLNGTATRKGGLSRLLNSGSDIILFLGCCLL
jgi:hypothetical protein